MKRLILFLFSFLLMNVLSAQNPNYGGGKFRMQYNILKADSVLLMPKRTVLYFPYNLGKDSIGGMFFYTGDSKFYGKFTTGLSKAMATEDSILAQTLQRVSNKGNQTTNTIAITGTGGINSVTGLHLYNGGLYFGNYATSSPGVGAIAATQLTITGHLQIDKSIFANEAYRRDQADSAIASILALIGHQSPGLPTFSGTALVNDILGTGYSVTITGDGDHMLLNITTGTGISNTGTVGYITLPTPFSTMPFCTWSKNNTNAIVMSNGVGFNATGLAQITFFTTTSFSNSTNYLFSIHNGL